MLRVFQSWKHSQMLTAFKYLCHSVIIKVLLSAQDEIHGSKTKVMHAIEAIQLTFTYKITKVQHLNYWERLHKLK